LVHAQTHRTSKNNSRIGSLTEEVEIATNVKLDPLYMVDRKDEIESLRWTTRIIQWVLDRAIDGQQYLEVDELRSDLEDAKKFENILHDKIQELEIELEDSNTDSEEEVIVNRIDTLKCVLDHLSNLKYGENMHATEIVEINQQAMHRRKKLIKIQDVESEISAQIQN
jgi:hypothetical protein